MIDRFLEAHLGPGSSKPGNGRFERAALHLFLAGRLDTAALRLERALASSLPEGVRSLLLALFARHRDGHPQAKAADLLAELSAGLEMEPSRWPRDFDAAAHRALVAAAKPDIVAAAGRALERLESDPAAFGRLFGRAEGDPLPLVCVEDGVFAFARWHAAQESLLARFAALARREPDIPVSRIGQALREIDALPGPALHPAQRLAVRRALEKPLSLVTGGPGTGKTTVVSRILFGLSRCLDGLDPAEVALCAPTGRAKARLAESVGRNLSDLSVFPSSPAPANLPASTVHSLLGMRPDGSYRHHAGNPLACRVVVLDEASMVDLPLFAALLEALPSRARLVVVGDPDQLPSVEAGAVLADLVGNPDLADHRVHLVHTHRNAGEIAEICRMVVEGGEVAGWLASRPCPDPRAVRARDGGVAHLGQGEGVVEEWLDRRFGPSLEVAARSGFSDPLPLLEAARRSRLLCAVHDGPSGVLDLNRRGDRWLLRRFPSPARGRFAPGQQVILTRNHPARDLWNGDLGVVVRRDDRWMAVFERPGGLLAAPLEQLEGLESAWAITVHKAQGSEFDEILFALPDRDTPILTRQILYTALSRARRTVFVHGDPQLAARAVGRSADRPGRLRGAHLV